MSTKQIVIVVGLPLLVMAMLFTMGALSQRAPRTLGVLGGRLANCNGRPNCVSSQASDDALRVAPLEFGGSSELAWDRLRAAVSSMEGATIVTDDGEYLHAEFRSRIFRFVDDLELMLDEDGHKVEVRSAARIGYSDMGANQRRVDRLRIAFSDLAVSTKP